LILEKGEGDDFLRLENHLIQFLPGLVFAASQSQAGIKAIIVAMC